MSVHERLRLRGVRGEGGSNAFAFEECSDPTPVSIIPTGNLSNQQCIPITTNDIEYQSAKLSIETIIIRMAVAILRPALGNPATGPDYWLLVSTVPVGHKSQQAMSLPASSIPMT